MATSSGHPSGREGGRDCPVPPTCQSSARTRSGEGDRWIGGSGSLSVKQVCEAGFLLPRLNESWTPIMSTFAVGLFVIGGGSGGVRAARIAAGCGARLMLGEEDRVSGTCMIRAARRLKAIKLSLSRYLSIGCCWEQRSQQSDRGVNPKHFKRRIHPLDPTEGIPCWTQTVPHERTWR